ncbi:spermidine synthase [Desulfobacula sp.]|uniref:spermidine synthase n=1 Tax=Desulfobacula sp. TaxID=2593537 RepID=UPI00262B52F3|nr:spermidine synthase [Desulfobacula sp.]
MKNYSKINDGWFSEICPMWPGISLSLEIEAILYSKKSPYQQIDLYQTRNHGKMLVLDGIIQLTESDEFAYQEMLAHVPLFAHPHPETVLVIGGGDGGVLREVGRHDGVKIIDFCEIDEAVIDVSKEFLPDMACGFDDPRVRVHIGDGNAYIHGHKNKYDVIIVDSSDPIGPGEILFEQPFYEGLKSALKHNGVIATQGESFFMHKECVANLVKITKELFVVQGYSSILVPTYPGGHIGICLGSLGPEVKKPCRSLSESFQQQLKYYTPQIHEASFVLPYFAKTLFDSI